MYYEGLVVVVIIVFRKGLGDERVLRDQTNSSLKRKGSAKVEGILMCRIIT